MKRKALYDYNNGHNPFPHIHGGALEETDTGGYRYDMNDEDDNIYLPNEEGREGGRPTGDWYERDGNTFTIHTRHGDDYKLYYDQYTSTFDYDVPEGEIEDVIDVSQEPLEYLKYDDDDDEEEFTNETLLKVIDSAKESKNYNSLSSEEKVKLLDVIAESMLNRMKKNSEYAKNVMDEYNVVEKENNKKLKRAEIMINVEKQKDPEKYKLNVIKAVRLYLQIGDKTPISKLNDVQRIKNHINFIKATPVDEIYKMIYILDDRMGSTQMSKSEKEKHIYVIDRLYDVGNPKMNEFTIKLKKIINMNEVIDNQMSLLNDEKKQLETQIKKEVKGQKQTTKKTQEQLKEEMRQQTKEQYETKQEKAARELQEKLKSQKATAEDLKEIEAEQKQKAEAGLSKAALKKQKAKEAKTAKEAAEAKAEEKPVELAKVASKVVGQYGKKLEEFLTSKQGSPILNKLSNDDSKIYDNEYNPEIPDIIVSYNDGTEGPLSKSCTLDLYNDTYVFEIKNYMKNSIKDSIIPLQGSKLEGTGYFNPLYLENGELYNLELNYIDPNTGERVSKFILPENPEGRTLVIVVRLKEGLYQYKPMMDKEHVELEPLVKKVKVKGKETIVPVLTPQKKQIYVFKSTSLQPCKDYNQKDGSYNIKPFLKPI